MNYMLDTNALIAAVRHPDWPIRARVIDHLGQDLCISSVTLAELEYGIRKSTRPDAGEIFAALERIGQRIGDRDTLIAAHARSLGCILVTHNTREFARVEGLHIEDWQL